VIRVAPNKEIDVLKKQVPVLVLTVFLAGGLCAETVRTIEEDLALEPGEILDLDLPIGELRVEGSATGGGSVRIDVQCSRKRRRCQSAAQNLELDLTRRGDRLRLEIEGWPRWGTSGLSLSILVEVPHSSPLRVDMGIGQVTVADLHSNVSIDLGIGGVEVEMAAEFVRSVNLESGIGESTMAVAGDPISNHRSFLGDELNWSKGEGEARINVDLGIGAVEVTLN